MGALEAMLEYGLEIPKDVSIMAFDPLSSFPYYGFTKCFHPEFTSIIQPLESIGLRTADLMLHRLEQGMKAYEPINVELKTIFRMTRSVADMV